MYIPTRQDRSAILGPVGVSILIHFLVLSLVPAFGTWSSAAPIPSRDRGKVLRVRFADPVGRLRTSLPDPTGQLVDILDSKPTELKAPAQARFLSDKNRSVERETQARFTGPNPNSPVGSPRPDNTSETTGSSGRKARGAGSGKLILDVPDSILKQGPQGTPGRLAMVAPSNYLPEIAMGDETLLNTREYAYATYFIRMKRQMESTWNPRAVIDAERLTRDQYVTTLGITLRNDGSVEDVRVVEDSGNPRLDHEAVESVRKAAPYLNPPTQLVEADERIHIPVWHFIVTLRATY
jgi:TonB family protein